MQGKLVLDLHRVRFKQKDKAVHLSIVARVKDEEVAADLPFRSDIPIQKIVRIKHPFPIIWEQLIPYLW